MAKSESRKLRSDHLISSTSGNAQKWSLYTLILYFAVQPFNDSLHRIVLVGSYLDLLWGMAFLAWALLFAMRKTDLKGLIELKCVILWVAYLVFCYFLANNEAGPESGSASQSLYNLRYLLQSVPVFGLVIMRGLSRAELNSVLTTIVIATPFSIYTTYRELLLGLDLQKYIDTGYGIAYNTYVPYTTFPLLASVYLFSQAKSRLHQILIAIPAGMIAVFIFVNISRQSVIFVILGFSIFVGSNFGARNILITAVCALAIVISVNQLDISARVVSRFFTSEVTETTRTELTSAGIQSINGTGEWLLGGGLDMTTESGVSPHNNYVFTVMRIGLVGLLLTFFPFVRAFINLIISFFQDRKKPWFDRNLFVLKAICVLFFLYHSFFGYPNMDAINGPVVWLGLGIWVVFDSDFQMREMRIRRKNLSDINC